MTASVALRRGLATDLPVEIAQVAGRRLRHLRRAPGRFVGITMNPLVSMIVLGYLFKNSLTVPGGHYQDYLFAGVAVQVGLASVGPTAIAVASDLQSGLVERFRSLPIARAAVLAGHTLADFLVSILALGVVTGFGVALGWRPHDGLGRTALGFVVVLAFVYAMVWVGAALGMSVRRLESVDGIATLVAVVVPFVSSAFLATSNLPGWLAPVAEWNPVSAVVITARNLWGYPQSPSGFVGEHAGVLCAAWLVGLLVFASVFSVRRFRTAIA